MGKNIILCSDGTGNKGGSTPDSNVFKIYKAIKLNYIEKNHGDKENNHDKKKKVQVTFYDNGVGTSSFSIMKAIGGGMGWGFEENVKDLYKFLGQNYEPGDDIYIFGFSRGAATVRAFAGLIEHCGLVLKHKEDGTVIEEAEFERLIEMALAGYQKGKIERDENDIAKRAISKNFMEADSFRKNYAFEHEEYAPDGKLKIEFMGIWDTVSALGSPQIPPLDKILDIIKPHKFYDLEPENCVKNVYHAIAVDDERRTFWPLVWDESKFNGTIEQVWFPGMHSNVGGGYNRQELANVTFDWMVERLASHKVNSKPRNGGLDLKPDAINDACQNANPFGLMYDSREGLAIFYRYYPRPIQELCEKILIEPIKIHDSVIHRMKYETAGYAPIQLPDQFDVVATRNSDVKKPPESKSFKRVSAPIDMKAEDSNSKEKDKTFESFKKSATNLIKERINLYKIFLSVSIILILFSLVLWIKSPLMSSTEIEIWRDASCLNWALGHIADTLRYVLPDFFNGFITFIVILYPICLLILGVVVWLFLSKRRKLIDGQEEVRSEMRKSVVAKWKQLNEENKTKK